MISSRNFALAGTYVKRAFQMSGELPVQNTIFGTAKYNSTIIYNWTKNKFASLQLPETIRTYSKNHMGYEVNIIYKPEEPYFCVKASHPDQNVPGRIWTTEAEIILVNEKLLFGVKVSYSTPITSAAESVAFSMPKFVTQIAWNNGILDVRRLSTEVWEIANEAEIEQLYDLVQDANRKMPVVVITENDAEQEIGEQYTKGYLVDASLLAKKVGTIAHVVRISSQLIDKWNEVTGKQWGVYGGAVRTYFPGADFGEEDYLRHPLSVVNRIMASYYTDGEGKEYIAGDAFRCILEENLRKHNTSVRMDWSALGHKFFFVANKEILSEKEKEISDIEQLRQNYEMQIRQLEDKLQIADAEFLTALMELEEKDKELGEARNTIFRLNSRVDALEYQIENSKVATEEIPIWNDYSRLPEWVETYLPGRVFLHSRAIQSLKKAVYEDAELVYKCLLMLGTTYYQMRLGKAAKSEFDEQCKELGVDECRAISDTAAGSQGDVYYVIHNNERVKMDRHLTKGKVRDPKRCMRIYFFWSEEESRVVIGSLPQHLEISSS